MSRKAGSGDISAIDYRPNNVSCLSAFDLVLGGDNRPTLQNSLVSEDPDLARGSEVFYYSSAGFLTVLVDQPSSQQWTHKYGGRLELI